MKELQYLLEEIALLSGQYTDKQQAIDNDKERYLYLEYASVYGGYRLVNVNVKGGGHSGAFGESSSCSRRNKKEMMAYLTGLLNGFKP